MKETTGGPRGASLRHQFYLRLAQVNPAITSMDEVTQQNAALAEQTSAASASLYARAGEMENVTASFALPAALQTGPEV